MVWRAEELPDEFVWAKPAPTDRPNEMPSISPPTALLIPALPVVDYALNDELPSESWFKAKL